MRLRTDKTFRAVAGGGRCVAAMVFVSACQTSPEATPDAPVGTASASSTSSPPPGPAASSAGVCADLEHAVMEEARKLAPCQSDADCGLHPTICGLPGMCYAIPANKSRSTTSFDEATSAFTRRCGSRKCKCRGPGKSLCSSGMCTAE